MPSGRCARTSLSRSETTCLAKYNGVESVNTSVMIESPGSFCGTHLGHPRQTRHSDFNGDGDHTLHFVRRSAGNLSSDLNLDIGDVRKCVYGKLARSINTKRKRDKREDNNDYPLIESSSNQSIDHVSGFSALIAKFATFPLIIEVECSVEHNHFAVADSVCNDSDILIFRSQRHRAHSKLPRSSLHENVVRVVFAHNRT